MGNVNDANGYVYMTCMGQEANVYAGCFAWGPGSTQATSFFLIWTSQNNVVLATVRGEIQEGGARGSFIINNNTATSINHSVIVEPSHTNPN